MMWKCVTKKIVHLRPREKGKGSMLTSFQPESVFFCFPQKKKKKKEPGWYKLLHFPPKRNDAQGQHILGSGRTGAFTLFSFGPRCMAYGISVPQPGVKPVSPALEAWRLNHWTARKPPELEFEPRSI